jgi:hypothetical protein
MHRGRHARPRPKRRAPLTILGVLALLLATLPATANSPVEVVDATDLGTGWFYTNILDRGFKDGGGQFVKGPANSPHGNGSFEMWVDNKEGHVQFATRDHVGTSLADVTAIDYWTYRSSGAEILAISLNIEVRLGDDVPFATLVYEPYLNCGSGSCVAGNTWQWWEASDGLWWATRDTALGDRGTRFTWDQLTAAYPDAVISGVFGLNVGSGWEEFRGSADMLHLATTTSEITYDFEPMTGG